MQNSPAYTLNKADLAHIGRHFLFTAIGAGITMLLSTVVPNLQVSGTVAVFMPFVVLVLTTLQSFFSTHNN